MMEISGVREIYGTTADFQWKINCIIARVGSSDIYQPIVVCNVKVHCPVGKQLFK
jgi:hypothetical protein